MKKICLVIGIVLILAFCVGCEKDINPFKKDPGIMIDVPLNQERADGTELAEERDFEDLSVSLATAENSDEITNSIILDDVEFVFPCSLSVLLENNWSVIESKGDIILPLEKSDILLQNRNNGNISVTVWNDTDEEQELKDCIIVGVVCDLENGISAALTNNIKLGDSLESAKENSSVFDDVQMIEDNSLVFDRVGKVDFGGSNSNVDYELKLSYNADDVISKIEMSFDLGV